MTSNSERPLTDIFFDLRSSVAKVMGYRGDKISVGTGFLVHTEGYVVTAHHIVNGGDRIEIVPDNWRHPIPVKRRIKNRDDMAILKIDDKKLDANFKVRFAPAYARGYWESSSMAGLSHLT